MPNSDLVGKQYNIDNRYQSKLGTSMSYEAMKMRKSNLDTAKANGNTNEFDRLGGDDVLRYIDNTLSTDRSAIKTPKKIGMDTGRENQFIAPHEKDQDNADPTSVGAVPKMNKGSMNRKIFTDKEVYNESVKKEINKIMYLIEYMQPKTKRNGIK